MPSWLIPILKFALSYGGPLLLAWLKNLLASKYPEIAQIISDLLGDLNDPTKSNSQARKAALHACNGIGCAPDLKRDD